MTQSKLKEIYNSIPLYKKIWYRIKFYFEDKKHKALIPRGPYCYRPIKIDFDNGGFSYQIKSCPYWQGDYCKLLNETDFLIADQVKICGINREQ